MYASEVRLATRMSPLVLAYMRWRIWPGCTTSKAPWHMITRRLRGRGPMRALSSSAVLIFRRYLASAIAGRPAHAEDHRLASGGPHGADARRPEAVRPQQWKIRPRRHRGETSARSRASTSRDLYRRAPA